MGEEVYKQVTDINIVFGKTHKSEKHVSTRNGGLNKANKTLSENCSKISYYMIVGIV